MNQHNRTGSATNDEPRSLEDVLDRLEAATEHGARMSVGDVVEAAGTRSFAALLLIPGLVMLAPGIGDIPGVPVLMGMLVILVVVQMLMGRSHLWLPGWLCRRSAQSRHVKKAVSWLRRPSRFIDRWSRPRLGWALTHGGFFVIGVCCIAVSMATPLMEVVPFTANLAGLVITAFGLALLERDGLIALLAAALAVGTGVLVVIQLL